MNIEAETTNFQSYDGAVIPPPPPPKGEGPKKAYSKSNNIWINLFYPKSIPQGHNLVGVGFYAQGKTSAFVTLTDLLIYYILISSQFTKVLEILNGLQGDM